MLFDDAAPLGTLIYNTDTNQLQYLQETVDATSKQTIRTWESATDGITTNSEMGTETLTMPSTSGSLFFNESENVLYIYNSVEETWVPIGGNTFITEETTIQGNSITYTTNQGATATFDFSAFSDNQTESQTLSVSSLSDGNTVSIAISGGIPKP